MSSKGYISNYYHNLMNIPGKVDDVAVGFAFGILVSFTPLIGFHVALIFLLTFLFKKSFGAGLLASLVFNPLTAPFILAIEYQAGHVLLGINPRHIKTSISIDLSDFGAMWNTIAEMFWPVLVGGAALGIPLSIVSYFLVKDALLVYRKRIYNKVYSRIKAMKQK